MNMQAMDIMTFPYIGCKIIRAAPMSYIDYQRRKGIKPEVAVNPPGYLVQYPDGYESWSSKSAFEQAYRQLEQREINFANK